MGDPTDQPAQQTESDSGDQGEQLVRLDVGGWISGPCLDAAALKPPPDGRTGPGWAWAAGERQRTAQ
jgi:hypothetical protein